MSVTPLLNIEDLELEVNLEDTTALALNGISFHINPGESLGVVGESGCGKSLTALAVMHLLESNLKVTNGSITFENRNLLHLERKALREIRGNDISMIFQEPMTSLNPVFTIGHQLIEALILHRNISKKQARELSVKALEEVGIPSARDRMNQYPHNLSGGMRQRVMIAMALACRPRLLIADEPTTALDVTIQAQILRIVNRLRKKHNMSVMFITHDLGVVAAMCERVVVMYAGQVVETAPVREIFNSPLHPYTKGLISSIPLVEGEIPEKLPTIRGRVPSLQNMPKGCRFHPRCDHALEICTQNAPGAFSEQEHHNVACWLYDPQKGQSNEI